MSQGKSWYSYLKQTKCHFFSYTKPENRRVEQVRSWRGWHQWEEEEEVGKGWERVWKGEYGANTMYSCMKMEK
jgi:hypothetical protein